jgi:hypothetical protein
MNAKQEQKTLRLEARALRRLAEKDAHEAPANLLPVLSALVDKGFAVRVPYRLGRQDYYLTKITPEGLAELERI